MNIEMLQNLSFTFWLNHENNSIQLQLWTAKLLLTYLMRIYTNYITK